VRALAEQLITKAAVAAGIDESAVVRLSPAGEVTKACPRCQVQILTEPLTRKFRRLKKSPTPKTDGKYRTILEQIFVRSLSIRAELVWDGDEAALEAAVKAFLLALPGKVADDAGNLVTVRPSRAERSGYEPPMVEVVARRRAAIHIVFTGRITRETVTVMITDVNIKDGVDYKEADNG
jgi:hypothetical protein